MRPYVLRIHRSARSIHSAAGHIRGRPGLALIRRVDAWAFVSVPVDEAVPCVVNMWYGRGCPPELVGRVLGHELGHISDGGPKDSEIGALAEEERAEEFAEAAASAVALLLERGVVSPVRAATRRSRRRRTS